MPKAKRGRKERSDPFWTAKPAVKRVSAMLKQVGYPIDETVDPSRWKTPKTVGEMAQWCDALLRVHNRHPIGERDQERLLKKTRKAWDKLTTKYGRNLVCYGPGASEDDDFVILLTTCIPVLDENGEPVPYSDPEGMSEGNTETESPNPDGNLIVPASEHDFGAIGDLNDEEELENNLGDALEVVDEEFEEIRYPNSDNAGEGPASPPTPAPDHTFFDCPTPGRPISPDDELDIVVADSEEEPRATGRVTLSQSQTVQPTDKGKEPVRSVEELFGNEFGEMENQQNTVDTGECRDTDMVDIAPSNTSTTQPEPEVEPEVGSSENTIPAKDKGSGKPKKQRMGKKPSMELPSDLEDNMVISRDLLKQIIQQPPNFRKRFTRYFSTHTGHIKEQFFDVVFERDNHTGDFIFDDIVQRSNVPDFVNKRKGHEHPELFNMKGLIRDRKLPTYEQARDPVTAQWKPVPYDLKVLHESSRVKLRGAAFGGARYGVDATSLPEPTRGNTLRDQRDQLIESNEIDRAVSKQALSDAQVEVRKLRGMLRKEQQTVEKLTAEVVSDGERIRSLTAEVNDKVAEISARNNQIADLNQQLLALPLENREFRIKTSKWRKRYSKLKAWLKGIKEDYLIPTPDEAVTESSGSAGESDEA